MCYNRYFFSRSGLTILESIVVLIVCSLILVVAVPVGMVQMGMLHPPSIEGAGGRNILKDSPAIVVPPMPALPQPRPPSVPGLDASGRIIIEGDTGSKKTTETGKP